MAPSYSQTSDFNTIEDAGVLDSPSCLKLTDLGTFNPPINGGRSIERRINLLRSYALHCLIPSYENETDYTDPS